MADQITLNLFFTRQPRPIPGTGSIEPFRLWSKERHRDEEERYLRVWSAHVRSEHHISCLSDDN